MLKTEDTIDEDSVNSSRIAYCFTSKEKIDGVVGVEDSWGAIERSVEVFQVVLRLGRKAAQAGGLGDGLL